MSEQASQHDIATKTVRYQMPGTEDVGVRRDIEFRGADGTALALDIYHPPAAARRTARAPLVLIVAGYPDAGFQRFVGRSFKDIGSTTSWARLIAASGMAAIAYTNRAPGEDLDALRDHIAQHAAALDVDATRIGIWASSGNGPLALSRLMNQAPARRPACAALFYGCTLDLEGTTAIADAARAFGFVNPCAGTSVADLPEDVPLFLARAGDDRTPGLNDAMDRFLASAVRRNLAVTFVNHPAAPHAFDLFDDSAASGAVVQQALSFLRAHLVRDT
jgi:hypothetical protein